MNISVFGLGYVGVVTAGCFCRDGHRVIGVDVAQAKVDQLNAGETPIHEEGMAELIRDARTSGRLTATTSAAEAVASSEMAIVCVGTPSLPNGSLNTGYVQAVVTEIGTALRGRTKPFLLVVRSTMLPGTMRSVVLPALASGLGENPGTHCQVVYHPEFLREGTSIKDFYDPPKIVVGENAAKAADPLLSLYSAIPAPVFRVSYETAEMVKYSDNIFHALKITFANEIGQFCHAQGIDSREIMDIFCSDTKLNLSPKYLRPGFAFGGSCLPKDLRAFLYAARRQDVYTPMLANVLPSNKGQIEGVFDAILRTGVRRIGFWGLAFKPGTDDLRESPLVTLAELLGGKGLELKIHDEFVQITRLVGGNKAFIEQTLPHLARLLVANAAELDTCELIVLGHPVDAQKLAAWLGQGKKVYDLTGMKQPPRHPNFQSVN